MLGRETGRRRNVLCRLGQRAWAIVDAVAAAEVHVLELVTIAERVPRDVADHRCGLEVGSRSFEHRADVRGHADELQMLRTPERLECRTEISSQDTELCFVMARRDVRV